MGPRTYEITIARQRVGSCAEFDDCPIFVDAGSTTLRAEVPDQCAMAGLVQRMTGLRLEIARPDLPLPARQADRMRRRKRAWHST